MENCYGVPSVVMENNNKPVARKNNDSNDCLDCFLFGFDSEVCTAGNILENNMRTAGKRMAPVDSLMSMAVMTVSKNTPFYFKNGYKEIISSLPTHVRNKLLRTISTSPKFWQDQDLNMILSALCNVNTKHVNLTTWTPNDETLKILGSCRDLVDLYLTRIGPCEVTSKGLVSLFPKLKHLQTICITGCQAVTDEVIRSIAENCRQLSLLDVGDCRSITDKSLVALSRLENLLSLRVFKTQISEIGLDTLVSGPSGPKLTELRVDNCHNLNQKILLTLTTKCPNLEILTFHSDRITTDPFQYSTEDMNMPRLKQVMYTIAW